MKKIIYIVLGISLVLNLILVISIVGQSFSISNNNKTITDLTAKNKSLNNKLKDYQINNDVDQASNNADVKKLIQNFCHAQFDYDNSNYVNRFDNVKKYVTNDVYNALKGSGSTATPKTQFKNEVKNLNIYLTSNDSKNIKALVHMTNSYTIQGTTSDTDQFYEFDVSQQNGSWIINKISLMGSFTPYKN